MKASFDGGRKNLANSFNAMARTKLDEEQKEEMENLRQSVVALLCMYDDKSEEDCNCLIDSVPLERIDEER